ncbi:MAG: hypothetical protein ACK58L_03410 [Planctomycetota bacterium]
MLYQTAPVSSESTTVVPDESRELVIRLERRLQCLMQVAVRVHVCEDQLQLFGTVPSWYMKQQAQETARELAPEYRIRNELRVAI